ncbi:MAG: rhodanese-like domain-containing protein [Acidobacteriaceae bacterium]
MLIYEITPEALFHAMGEQTGLLLLDVREPWETQAAPFPGAVAMPMGEVPSRAFTELDPDEPVVVVCHHGVRSLHVVQWLREQGFERAQSLAGGMDAWALRIDPRVGRY